MLLHPFTTFSKPNRKLILLLISCHLLWSGVVFGLWQIGQSLKTSPFWSTGFIALQLFAAAQLVLPALLLHPEERNRSFYIFWGLMLTACIWLSTQWPATLVWQPLLNVIKSGLLLLIATLVAAALARYVRRLWELVPICIVMTLADFASWSHGPTAMFAQQIEQYYLAPEGPAPLIDMILVKVAIPGFEGLAPIFGISDWIIVVFFAIVAHRHRVNDNLFGTSGEILAKQKRIGRYLPISVVALYSAIILAQTTGLFIPALPMISLGMLLWYAIRYLIRLRHA